MHQMQSNDYLQDIWVKTPLWLGHDCHTWSQKRYVMGYYKSQKEQWVPHGCFIFVSKMFRGWFKGRVQKKRKKWQNFNKGTKIHTIEIWNIDSKKYPEILSSEYFGILIPNSNWGTKLSHISDSVYSREEYHTCLMQILFNVNPNPYFSFYLSSFVNINISCYIEISISCCETNWTIN